jgi:protein TonB
MSTHQPPSPVSEGVSALPAQQSGAAPVQVRFLFDVEPPHLGGAMGARNSWLMSVLSHAALLGIILLIGYLLPERVYEAVLPDRLPDQIVWLAQPGPGGGGGGGGNKMPEPPKPAEIPGKQKINTPVVQPPEPTPQPKPEPPKPEQELNIPAQLVAAAPIEAPGAIEPAPATTSQGAGTGGGAGTGTGAGIGQGTGSGLGPGTGGGVGGGAYRPGNGVMLPRVLQEVKPAYTAEAMRAKVQGTVLLECVVMPDGTVGTVDVVKSLDSSFGLDQEAIKAAKRWRFAPGTRFGEPVPVLVTIELTFTLR